MTIKTRPKNRVDQPVRLDDVKKGPVVIFGANPERGGVGALAELFDRFPEAVFVLDSSMRICGTNRVFDRFYNAVGPTTGMCCRDLFCGGLKDCATCSLQNAFDEIAPRRLQLTLPGYEHLHVTLFPMIDPKHGRTGLLGRLGLKHTGTESQDVDNEAYFQYIFQIPTVGLFWMDGSGRIIEWNRTMTEITGLARDEVLGRAASEIRYLLIPEARRTEDAFLTVERTIQELVQSGQPVWRDWHRRSQLQVADGRYKWVQEYGLPIMTSHGIMTLGVVNELSGIVDNQQALTDSQALYRTIFESTGTAMLILEPDGTITLANTEMKRKSGYEFDDILGSRRWTSFVIPEDRDKMVEYHRTRRKAPDSVPDSYEFRFVDAYGNIRDCSVTVAMIPGTQRSIASVVDISNSKRTERELIKSKQLYQNLVENANEALFNASLQGIISYISPAIERMAGYSVDEIIGRSVSDFVHPDDMIAIYRDFEHTTSGRRDSFECRIAVKDGDIRYVRVSSRVILEAGAPVGLNGIITDITERIEMENQLRYLSLHDTLTGLHNRAYFEREMHRLNNSSFLEAGIIMCDVDGLKLVNDTLGHEAGDRLLTEAAAIIAGCFPNGEMVARVGGDEFAILLPSTTFDAIEAACEAIRTAAEEYNQAGNWVPICISVGSANRNGADVPMDELYREADNLMYREKLHSSRIARSEIVHTLMKALEARDHITEGHGDRLELLSGKLAQKVGIPARRIDDLKLFAQFHDIGKVGVPERILFKPGRLTPKEYEEIRRHSEIGHRIAQSAAKLQPIADWILKHHEWWDGQGYPLGIAKEDIPLECRIMSIVDAYDAMTSERPYRRPLSKESAVQELARCAGTQFDPGLVEMFIALVDRSLGEESEHEPSKPRVTN
ncbi:MAG: PAS domain S-box protein [Solirubrobacterales bacterium]